MIRIDFTEDQMQRMEDLYRSRVSRNKIAEIYGVDVCTIRNRLVDRGVPSASKGRYLKFTDSQCIEFYLARQAGTMIKVLAFDNRCGLSTMQESIARGARLYDQTIHE